MTAIAAITDGNIIYMGGDSAGVAGISLSVRKDEKVFINGPFIMGFTTSFRMGSLLKYSFTPPEQGRVGIERYMNTIFIDAVRQCLKDGGFAKNHSGEESGGTFVVGYKGKLFEIHGDFQVAIPYDNFTAVGCGEDLCKGSLFSTKNTDMDLRQRVKIALQSAERFSGGVRGPFVIKKLEK